MLYEHFVLQLRCHTSSMIPPTRIISFIFRVSILSWASLRENICCRGPTRWIPKIKDIFLTSRFRVPGTLHVKNREEAGAWTQTLGLERSSLSLGLIPFHSCACVSLLICLLAQEQERETKTERVTLYQVLLDKSCTSAPIKRRDTQAEVQWTCPRTWYHETYRAVGPPSSLVFTGPTCSAQGLMIQSDSFSFPNALASLVRLRLGAKDCTMHQFFGLLQTLGRFLLSLCTATQRPRSLETKEKGKRNVGASEVVSKQSSGHCLLAPH